MSIIYLTCSYLIDEFGLMCVELSRFIKKLI